MTIQIATAAAPMITAATARSIREYYGHSPAECRVRIARDGTITRFGSVTLTDRSRDYWALVGTVGEALREIERSIDR